MRFCINQLLSFPLRFQLTFLWYENTRKFLYETMSLITHHSMEVRGCSGGIVQHSVVYTSCCDMYISIYLPLITTCFGPIKAIVSYQNLK